jgi:hypothetical protein
MKNCLAAALGFLLVLPLSGAELIYDNNDNFQLKVNATPFESGDQVQFAGESRVLDYFAFEFFATPSFAQRGGTARVRFYLNNGPTVTSSTNSFAAPGTLLYDSGSFVVEPDSSTVEISGMHLYVPSDTLTWTVQFFGVATNERAGVLFYDPPGVGASDDFLWQFEDGAWRAIKAGTNIVNNLSARFEASPAFRVRSLKLENTAVALTATATPGRVYSLEYKTALDQPEWTAVEQSSLRATGGEVSLVDPSGAGGAIRIYRVVERDGTPPSEQTP